MEKTSLGPFEMAYLSACLIDLHTVTHARMASRMQFVGQGFCINIHYVATADVCYGISPKYPICTLGLTISSFGLANRL